MAAIETISHETQAAGKPHVTQSVTTTTSQQHQPAQNKLMNGLTITNHDAAAEQIFFGFSQANVEGTKKFRVDAGKTISFPWLFGDLWVSGSSTGVTYSVGLSVIDSNPDSIDWDEHI